MEIIAGRYYQTPDGEVRWITHSSDLFVAWRVMEGIRPSEYDYHCPRAEALASVVREVRPVWEPVPTPDGEEVS